MTQDRKGLTAGIFLLAAGGCCPVHFDLLEIIFTRIISRKVRTNINIICSPLNALTYYTVKT